MKVLVFTTLYPNNVLPNQGVFIKERMTQFARLDGCELKVVAPVPYFPPIKLNWRWRFSQVAKYEVRDGLEVYHPRYYMMPKWGMIFYGVLMFLSVLRAVKRLRNDFDFDLIDAHFVYPDGFAAVLLGKYFNKPVVVSARGSDINEFSRLTLVRHLLKFTLGSADKVIAVSTSLKQAITTLGISEAKISVVPNGVDSQTMRPVAKREARRDLGLPADKTIILSVGNITQNKGFHLLVKALKILVEKLCNENLYLVIVGEGRFRSELEKLISSFGVCDRVLLAGTIAHDSLYRWYSSADLFCLASCREGWPNVLLESLACGTPVVATNVGGIPEIITADYLGVIVERNEQALASAIESALKRQWNSTAIAEHAKNQSWTCVSLSLSHLFKSVVDKERPGKRQSLGQIA